MFPVAMERVLFEHHHLTFLGFLQLSKSSKEYVETGIVPFNPTRTRAFFRGTHEHQVGGFVLQ